MSRIGRRYSRRDFLRASGAAGVSPSLQRLAVRRLRQPPAAGTGRKTPLLRLPQGRTRSRF